MVTCYTVPMNAIEVVGVTKKYKDFTLDNVSLEVPEGTIVGLVGENGAGKTTLIRLIMGASAPDDGTINVLGVNNRDGAFAETKQDIGIVLDEGCLPLVKIKFLEKIFAAAYKNWDHEQFAQYLKEFEIPTNKNVKDVSRGTKMKLALALALSHHAKLLVLDEPTGGLDPLVRDEIVEVLGAFTQDKEHSILFSSHIISDMEKICDYVAFIHKGKNMFFERKDDLEKKVAEKNLPTLEEYIVAVAKEMKKNESIVH